MYFAKIIPKAPRDVLHSILLENPILITKALLRDPLVHVYSTIVCFKTQFSLLRPLRYILQIRSLSLHSAYLRLDTCFLDWRRCFNRTVQV